eukprot:7085246-Alexandrium_andersonii.AAC.1
MSIVPLNLLIATAFASVIKEQNMRSNESSPALRLLPSVLNPLVHRQLRMGEEISLPDTHAQDGAILDKLL